jgi:hypothetical protein
MSRAARGTAEPFGTPRNSEELRGTEELDSEVPRNAVSFSLATPEDDEPIRRLLARNSVPGRIRIRYEREPDYFTGCVTMGSTQVLVARSEGAVVGVACRSVRSMYINGEPAAVGYLGQLRVDRDFRGRWLVHRGFRMLHQLHRENPPRGYVTTIVEGNDEAEGILVRHARGATPRYRKIDRLLTLALRTGGRRAIIPAADRRPLSEVVALLQREGRRRNFFPAYSESDFANGAMPGFHESDFVTVEESGRLAGVAGLWDQRAFKQSIVDGYESILEIARPFYNVAAAMAGRPRLPRPGSPLALAYGVCFCVENDDPGVARRLIELLLARAEERRIDHLLIGFTESDPLLGVARRFPHVAYPAGIYTVGWENENDLHDQLDTRPRYLEVAAL